MPPFCEKHQRYFVARGDSWLSSCCPNCEQEYAQLARDEAKETSDVQRSGNVNCIGNVDRHGSTANPTDSNGTAPVATSVSAPDLAQKFHEAYERLAPQFGYETRKASAKPWAEVPENNRKLMTAVCREVMRGAADLLDKASAEIHMLERAAESHKYTVSDLRDSRDMLHEEFDVMRLRALSAEKIARIPIRTQDEEFIARRAALAVPDTE